MNFNFDLSLGKHTLKYEKFGHSLQSIHVITPSNDALVEPCKKMEFKIKSKAKGTRNRARSLKLKNFQFGPGLLDDIRVDEITNASAKVHFDNDSQGQSCAESYEIETTDASSIDDDQEPVMVANDQGSSVIENLSACHEHEVEVSPIFKDKPGIPAKKSFKTFPGPEMAQVNLEDDKIIIDPFEMKTCLDKITYLLVFEGSQIDKTEAVFKEDISFDMLAEEEIEKEDIKKQMTDKDILHSCAKYTMNLRLKTMKSDQEFVMDKYTLNIVTDKDRNLFYQSDMVCERQPRGTDQDGMSAIEDLLQTDPPEVVTDDPVLAEIDAESTGYSGAFDPGVRRQTNQEELNIGNVQLYV